LVVVAGADHRAALRELLDGTANLPHVGVQQVGHCLVCLEIRPATNLHGVDVHPQQQFARRPAARSCNGFGWHL
jgi:hypothetical protein